jgi:hypothetical protein
MAILDLHKNTISEFHENLMVYYELCKDKQSKHVGFWIQKIDQLHIPEFDIKKENIENRTILRNKNWGTKLQWRDHMKSVGYNKENTKLLMVDHNNLPKPLLKTLLSLPIKHPVFSLNIQPPGGMVPAHEDTWRIWYDKHPELAKKYTFKDTLFYSVFLTRQETGHTFSAGSTNLNWEAGDVYEMPYYCNHATSNAGFVPKMLVQCLGIKK